MTPFNFKLGTALVALLLVAGCAPKVIRVRCDTHLVPINPPTASSSNRAVDASQGHHGAKGARP